MKAKLMRAAVVVLKLIYIPFMPVKPKNKITFLSRQSDNPTVDIKLLDEGLDDRKIKTVVLTKRLNKTVGGFLSYSIHMLLQMYHISTSKLLVLDGYCILASILPKKDDQKIVQIWHALGAIKKFGYQSIGKPEGNDPEIARVMRLHEKYDYVIAPGRTTAECYSEAFNISKDKIKLYGLPRIDYLVEESKAIEDRIKSVYPQVAERENILYVPTFRKNKNNDVTELIKNARLEKYNLIIRKHWLDKTDYSWVKEYGVIVDKRFSSLEWLKFCSKVVTDYSAVAFEAAILEKQLYFYINDVDDYIEKIGLNIELEKESIGDYVFSDSISLWNAVDDEYDPDKIREFKSKYINVAVENCTSRLAEFLISNMEE